MSYLNYKISVKSTDFRKFIENDTIDKSSRHVQYLKGSKWLRVIEHQVQCHEKNQYKMRAIKTRLLWHSDHKKPFLVLTADCKICHIPVTFTMKNQPSSEEEFIFEVNRFKEHDNKIHRMLIESSLSKTGMATSAYALNKYHDEQIKMGLTKQSSKDVIHDYVKELLKKEIVLNNQDNEIDDKIDEEDLMNTIFYDDEQSKEDSSSTISQTEISSNPRREISYAMVIINYFFYFETYLTDFLVYLVNTS